MSEALQIGTDGAHAALGGAEFAVEFAGAQPFVRIFCQASRDDLVQSMMHGAELDAEKLSALVRAVVFAALAIALSSSGFPDGHDLQAWVAMVVYGVGSAIGLFLGRWRGNRGQIDRARFRANHNRRTGY